MIFCGALFVVLNLIGFRAFIHARDQMQQSIVAAKAELDSDRSWFDIADTLRPAMNWMNDHPMQQMPPDDASAQLLKSERQEAEKAGLKVTEENLLPFENGTEESSVAVEAKLSGPFEGIVRMLFALQTPTGWRSIEKLTLRSDAQPPNVVADLQLRQYFHPGAAAAPSPATPIKNTP